MAFRTGRAALTIGAIGALVAVGLGTEFADGRNGQDPAVAIPEPPPAAVPIADLRFDTALGQAAALPRLRSLLISVDGQLVTERYFHGATAARAANMKSASKSVIATLVGIALDRGRIAGVRAPIGPFFPDDLRGDPERAAITIEDLLTMRSGLETTSNRNYGRWVTGANWVRGVLRQPFVDQPGGRMIYSTGSSHLLSAIVTKATGVSTLAFAREALGKPLGIEIAPWDRDPQGIYLGGNEMPMRPRDMVRFGELYDNDGRVEGRQVISEAWVRESIVPRTTSRFNGRAYGYGWWIRSLGGMPVFYAWGYGGQFIFVIQPLRTVVVTTSATEPGSERREHLDAIYDLVEHAVIPEAARAFPAAAAG